MRIPDGDIRRPQWQHTVPSWQRWTFRLYWPLFSSTKDSQARCALNFHRPHPVTLVSASEAASMRGNGNVRGFLGGIALAALAGTNFQRPTLASHFVPTMHVPNPVAVSHEPPPEPKLDVYIETYVTGYNTVRTQTDDDPCIAASGANICGRRDTIACPPLLPFGTTVEVRGRSYVCEDRMAARFRDRFDINCDKDKNCPYQVSGQTLVKVALE
jgi:hypothetical protein